MKNQEIAQIFWELADMMEIKQENPFRIGAIRKAARVIENLTEEVTELHAKNRLHLLPGIGKGIIDRIDQIIKTNTCEDLENLKKEIPSGLLQILQVPEVGPKTVQLVWKKLGITELSELEKAVREHKLKDLFRMGEKTEQNILRGIELLKRRKERLLLGEAEPLAEQVVHHLKKLSEVKRISVSGSLRRGKETIGDIDILVTSDNPEKVMDAFVQLPMNKEVLAKGSTKSSVLTELDIQMDLRVVPEESFGAALQYFTGSKEHNIALREMAGKLGLKISEYGVFRIKGEKKIAGKDEIEVYRTLGLPYIEPELRENMGECEAAKKGTLPHLITQKDIKGDLQIHSHYSDGSFSISDIAEESLKLGYQYIAITDHSHSLKVARGLDVQRIKKQKEEIAYLNKKYKKKNFYILSGIEVEIKSDGSLDLPDEVLSEIDFVIAAVHTGFKMDRDKMTNRIIKAMQNKNVDAIAHPTGRLINKRDAYEVDFEKLLSVALETNTLLEINSHPDRLDLRDIHIRKAKESGLKLIITTDAHQLSQLSLIKYGVIQARRGWAEKKDILNTEELPAVLEWLRK